MTKHINTVTHEGKVLIMATVVENGSATLRYTVKQDGFEDSALQNPNGSGWEAFKTLELPNDRLGDASVADKEQAELTDKQGKYLLRSIYDSAALTADAPVQLVSHDGHLYVFRQSTRGTLLVDRFVLDGMTNTLTPKLEVRFKRSRQRYTPLKAMKINSGGQMESLDSLDFRDMQNRPFTEPSTELCPELLSQLQNGWFGVVVTPTNEQENYRWHIFAHNRSSGKVDLVTLRAGSEQLFDLQDYWFRTMDPITDQVQYDSIPGLIHRQLELQDSAGTPLAAINGLAVIKYDVQREQQTQNGPQLVRDASKVLLAVPTAAGTATLSFAIGVDGRLAQIAGDSKDELLRSQEREILLPLNLLDNIRAVGDSTAAPAGVIAGMRRSDDDDSADRVRVQVSADDKQAVSKLKSGDTVKLSNTASYNGLYRVAKADDGSFVIDAPFKYGELGDWEKVEEEESGLIFDGMLTGYAKTGDGKLKVHAVNHGLAAGDLVQIVGDGDYSGEYPVLQHDEDSFTIERLWAGGEAVNIKLESRKRRGLVLDGKRDWISAPFSQPINLSAGFTVEAWVKLNSADDQTLLMTQPDSKQSGGAPAGTAATLALKDGKFTVAITRPLLGRTSALRIESATPAPLREWVHVACSFDGKELHLLENGGVKATVTVEELNRKARSGQDALAKQLEKEAAELRAAYTANPNHPANYWFRMAQRADGKVVTAGMETGMSRDQVDHRAEQLWRLEPQGDGAFAIRNKATNRVLEYVAADRPVQQTEWRNADSQKWTLEANTNDFYTFHTKTDGKVLDGYLGGFVVGNPWPAETTNAHWQQWRLVTVGPALAVEVQAALDALQGKGNQGKPTFSLSVSTISLAATPQIKAGKVQPADLLQGELADVRLWTSGRSDKAIANAMHLQLTGREAGLAGYWRLGGVALEEDGSQRVFDFSVNANHGEVQGAPYAGGVTLGRTLRDGKTEAVKLSNGDLFAVREGAVYVESFEFRSDKPVAPTNADGKDGVIFAPSLWGRLSRNSEEELSFAPMQEKFLFEDLGDGWQRAACRFIVPEGVRLLRCFEVAGVTGDWATLEMRRHTLRLVSDTVTLSTLEESAKLTALASSLANPAQPAELLRELDSKEKEEAPLVTRQKELERLLGDIANRNETERRRNDYQSLVQSLTWARDARQREYDAAMATPPEGEVKTDLWGEGNDATHIDWHIHTAEILAPPGKRVTGVQFYNLSARLAVKIRCANPDGSAEEWVVNEDLNGNAADHQDWVDTAPVKCPKDKVVTGVQFYKKGNRSAIRIRCSYPWGGGDEWVLNDADAGFFRSRRSEQNDFIDLHPVTVGADQVISGLQIRQYGNRIAPQLAYYSVAEINRTRNALNSANYELSAAQAELARLNQALNSSDGQRQQWQAELDEINRQLAAVRQRIAELTTSYLELIAKANNTAQTMPDLPDQEDPRGLTVQGALLPFAVSSTRLHALESCTGRVTLSYQDGDGNLRQTHYDAAYDADGKGEEWLPDGYRAALALDGRSPALPLPASAFAGLSNQVTIEFWAKGGSDLPKVNALLGALDSGGNRRLCIQLPNEKGEVVWEAGQKPANGAIDTLAQLADARLYRGRWTHWAFVKDSNAGEMRIYVDGKLWAKNDPKAKDGGGPRTQSMSGIGQAALGGFPRQTPNWHGQLAELRIWNVALGEREIEANSVLTLSGNEPGLLAYYPLNEAQGDLARDHSGRGLHFSIGGNPWAPCTAPIGRLHKSPIVLLGQPRKFDGIDAVSLPRMTPDFSEGISIEARVRFDQFRTWSRIIDLCDATTAKTILLANKDDSRRLIFQVHRGGGVVSTLESPTDLPQGQWVHVAATIERDGQGHLYVDGVEVATGKMDLPERVERVNNYLGKGSWGNPIFQGEMDAVRLYTYALSSQEVKGLMDGSFERSVICAEYSRVRVDAQRRKSVMMLRCLALPTFGGLRLVDEQRIEELEMQWIGNAQIKPTLIGYIEGAPPLPGENLTEEQDYNGATSVELIQSSDVEYSWTREQDVSLGAETALFVGVDTTVTAGLGVETELLDTRAGMNVAADFAYHWQNASTVGASHSLMSSDRLELRGSQEPEPHFPHLGQRFIPKNIGYAVVTSGLADVFVSKLKRSGRMIGYQVLPVEGVPMDVNTITFLINPAYTMAGSLDGMTGSRATSERFFRHVPEMRSQYGSLYPASYFRLKEAYDLKAQIDEQDKLHQAYFNQFNAGLVDETSLNRQVDDSSRDGGAVGVNSPDRSGGESDDAIKELDKKIEAKQKEIDELKKASPLNQPEVDKQQKELEGLQQNRREHEQAGRTKEGEQRQNDIAKKHSDLSARANASESFASWQKKMENLQVRAGKRNIVNTYVWDGDGGFHAEEQQFASTVEHTVGGSFDMGFAIGGEGAFAVGGVAVGLTAMAKVSMTQTMNKTERGSKGLELHVDLSGVESRGITDYRDYPILPGEKVDRYRFMSFFLENSTNHWHDFFNYVIDPEWLASNDEEARALRQAQSARPNKVWRVLHRVTYVERPALMGFGRSVVKSDEAADDIRALRDQLTDLQGKVATLQKEINEKLDQLLTRKA
ncbi:LamG-like jellyroll fold domain-containing protein [Candidatus Amarolinea dominans]|uniref:LamG-like jellyroll fold domain-containing protein n=1 Tax=Candidatus Amarolinea dominans TaxID=3140696 RepID=UPI001DA1BBDF|nr:RICIN domain-containing protein [Anaerolineae bacterium]